MAVGLRRMRLRPRQTQIMDLGTGIAASSVCIAAASAFAAWRHTATNDLRNELEAVQNTIEKLERRLSDCRSMNQWLLRKLQQRDGFSTPHTILRRVEETDDNDE